MRTAKYAKHAKKMQIQKNANTCETETWKYCLPQQVGGWKLQSLRLFLTLFFRVFRVFRGSHLPPRISQFWNSLLEGVLKSLRHDPLRHGERTNQRG